MQWITSGNSFGWLWMDQKIKKKMEKTTWWNDRTPNKFRWTNAGNISLIVSWWQMLMTTITRLFDGCIHWWCLNNTQNSSSLQTKWKEKNYWNWILFSFIRSLCAMHRETKIKIALECIYRFSLRLSIRVHQINKKAKEKYQRFLSFNSFF